LMLLRRSGSKKTGCKALERSGRRRQQSRKP
jgi:hypothetical protein